MTQLASGFIPLGRHVAHVQTTAETVRKSYYRVDGIRRGTGWFPGEVTVNAASVFACLTCLANACIHIDAVQKFLAGQPLEVVESTAATRQPLDTTATGGQNVGPGR